MSRWGTMSRITAASARGSTLGEACASPSSRSCTAFSRRGITSCTPARSVATRRSCLLWSGCAFGKTGLELTIELRPTAPEVVPRERLALAVALFGQRQPFGRERRNQGLIANDDLALERFVEFCQIGR